MNVETSEIPDVIITSKDQKNRPLLIAIIVLLALLLISNLIQAISTYQQNKITAQRATIYAQRVQEAEDLAKNQQELLESLLSDYNSDAYSAGVDRIAEQQLIASEYTMQVLQIIGIQNSQILMTLSSLP